MIKIVRIDGLNCPCAFCDICGERIERDGLMVWNHNSMEPFLLHKGDCDRANNILRGKCDASLELDKAIEYLLCNVRPGLTFKS